MNKIYLNAEQLLTDSYQLALDIFASGYRPDLVIGIWRGGTPIAIAIQEMLLYLGHDCDHMAIRTSSYTGIGQRGKSVKVDGLDYIRRFHAGHSLLLVDDVFDSGLSINQVIAETRQMCGDLCPQIRIAAPYFKPGNNRTTLTPDFYLHKTADWLVFPHELAGLSLDEVLDNKPALKPLREQLTRLARKYPAAD